MLSLFRPKTFECQWIAASADVPKNEQIVIVVLHGLGDSAKSYSQFHEELRLPHANYLLLNAPDKYDDGFTWYKLEPFHRTDILRNRKRLLALAQEIVERGYSSSQIFWIGHSQGCLMAFDHIMHSPYTYAGFVGVSGYVWFHKKWEQIPVLTPCLFTHGTRDRILPVSATRSQVEKMAALGWNIEWKTFSKGHSFDFEPEIRAIQRWIREPRRRISIH